MKVNWNWGDQHLCLHRVWRNNLIRSGHWTVWGRVELPTRLWLSLNWLCSHHSSHISQTYSQLCQKENPIVVRFLSTSRKLWHVGLVILICIMVPPLRQALSCGEGVGNRCCFDFSHISHLLLTSVNGEIQPRYWYQKAKWPPEAIIKMFTLTIKIQVRK